MKIFPLLPLYDLFALHSLSWKMSGCACVCEQGLFQAKDLLATRTSVSIEEQVRLYLTDGQTHGLKKDVYRG